MRFKGESHSLMPLRYSKKSAEGDEKPKAAGGKVKEPKVKNNDKVKQANL